MKKQQFQQSEFMKKQQYQQRKIPKKITIAWIAVLTSILLSLNLLSGCGSVKQPDEKTLIYGSGNYTAINPALYEHGEINSLIFLGLTSHDEKNKIAPGAAQKWSFEKETNTYHFALRKGLKFHDGIQLTAEDVKFTLEAILNPDNGSENISDFECIKEIKVEDKHHIDLILKTPNTALPDYLTIGILPKHLLEGKDMTTDPFNQAPIGAGPYKLTEWDRGQSITLERNKEFYLGAPKIHKIMFKIAEDYDTRALQLKSGEVDFAQITPKALAQFEGNPDFKSYVISTADYRGILYNFNHPLFKDNPELPKALSYGVDRQGIIDSVLLGHGQVAYSPLQKSIYNNQEVEKYSYQPGKTKKLLEQNGWEKGSDGIYQKNGTKLAFTINCTQGDQVRIDMATICAVNFREIGADVNVEAPPEIDWTGQQAYLIGWGSPFDPDTHTYKVLGTGQAANYSSYSNPAVDRLLGQSRQAAGEKERISLYQQFQRKLSQEPAFTYLAYIDAIYAGKAGITGITPDTVLGHHGVGIFWNIYDWDIN